MAKSPLQKAIPVVLLPGMMCDERMWQSQSEYLIRLGYQVINGDITGRELAKPVGEISIADIARQLLANLPAKFALAGLSMGGIVALEMWRQAPERITRLALLDTSALEDSDARREKRDEQIRAARSGSLEKILIEEMKPNYLAESNKRDELALSILLAMAVDLGLDVFVKQSLALKNRDASLLTLASIDCPTLVLCGCEDTLCPVEHHQQMAKLIKHAELKVLDDCGHLSTMEQPGLVNLALEAWLATPELSIDTA